MSESISITSGSDAIIPFAFEDGTGGAVAITSPVVIESTGWLEGKCTASLVDGPGGLASVFIEGSDMIPIGSYFLRLQATLSNGNTLASKRLLINVT